MDAAGYGASWTYDALGNAVSERSYAAALSATTRAALNASSDTAALATEFAANGAALVAAAISVDTIPRDRITLSSYDRMGRLVRKAVQNVQYTGFTNTTTGAIMPSKTRGRACSARWGRRGISNRWDASMGGGRLPG